MNGGIIALLVILMFLGTFGAFFLPGQTFTKTLSGYAALVMLALVVLVIGYGYMSGQ